MESLLQISQFQVKYFASLSTARPGDLRPRFNVRCGMGVGMGSSKGSDKDINKNS